MIRHIVMWNLKEEAEGNPKATNGLMIKNKLEGLVGKIEGLHRMEVNPNVVASGYDLCLYSELESLDALAYYKEHPLHKEIQSFVHAVITDRVSCDMEL